MDQGHTAGGRNGAAESPEQRDEVVRSEAEALARRCDLGAGRVYTFLRQLVDSGCVARRLPLREALRETIHILQVEDVLQLFTEQARTPVEPRLTTLCYLADPLTPLYTLGELADLTEEYLAHLERNRSDLARTGHSPVSFERSRWLDWHLGKLYPTKLPVVHPLAVWVARSGRADLIDCAFMHEVFECSTSAALSEDGNLVYQYVWVREPPEASPPPFGNSGHGFRWSARGPIARDGTPVTPCTYEEAAFIPGLEAATAGRLEGLREQLLDLEVRVLRRLLGAARAADATRLWTDCLELMTNSLLAKDAEFLLGMDSFYAQTRAAVPGIYRRCDAMMCICHGAAGDVLSPRSGFAGLLDLVGHYEKELLIGTMGRTRSDLPALPLRGSSLSSCETDDQSWAPELNAILDRLIELEREETSFWTDFTNRVNRAMEAEFCEEFVHRTRVPRGQANRYGALFSTLAAYVEATGQLPNLSVDLAAPPSRERCPRPESQGDRGRAKRVQKKAPRQPTEWKCPSGTYFVLDGSRTWLKWSDGRVKLNIKSNSHARVLLDYFLRSSRATSEQIRLELDTSTGKKRKTAPWQSVREVNRQLVPRLRRFEPTKDVPDDVIGGTGGVYQCRIPIAIPDQFDDWE